MRNVTFDLIWWRGRENRVFGVKQQLYRYSLLKSVFLSIPTYENSLVACLKIRRNRLQLPTNRNHGFFRKKMKLNAIQLRSTSYSNCQEFCEFYRNQQLNISTSRSIYSEGMSTWEKLKLVIDAVCEPRTSQLHCESVFQKNSQLWY